MKLGQNVGLFLAALMDRWVSIVMSARTPEILTYYDARARYAVCFGLLYFLLGAVAVDTVLQRYWALALQISSERLGNVDDLHRVLDRQDRFVCIIP